MADILKWLLFCFFYIGLDSFCFNPIFGRLNVFVSETVFDCISLRSTFFLKAKCFHLETQISTLALLWLSACLGRAGPSQWRAKVQLLCILCVAWLCHSCLYSDLSLEGWRVSPGMLGKKRIHMIWDNYKNILKYMSYNLIR